MGEAKIGLSQKELGLVTNADLILTKNDILQKVKQLLGQLQEKQQAFLMARPTPLAGETIPSSPKISKGENYQGLPYLILDHPRHFRQDDILAIRTMFWWGNFFSITLHLSGIYKKKVEQKIITSYTELKENGFYFCVNDDPWEHHFESGNYRDMREISDPDFEKKIKERSFIKLANKISLQQWDDAGEILLDHFKQIIELLSDQPPRR